MTAIFHTVKELAVFILTEKVFFPRRSKKTYGGMRDVRKKH